MSVWRRSKAMLVGWATILWGFSAKRAVASFELILPRHDWTVWIAGRRFGLIQFGSEETRIQFASLSVDVPFGAPATACLLAGVVVVVCLIGVAAVSASKRART